MRGNLLRTNLLTNPNCETNATYVNQNSTLVPSTIGVIAGTKSLAIVANSTSVDTAINTNMGGTRLAGLVDGKTYTVSGYITLTSAQSGPWSGTRARRIVVFSQIGTNGYTETSGLPAPNQAGTYRVSHTFTVPVGSTEIFIRFYSGADNTNDPVYWDALLLEEGTALNPYFDGSTLEGFDRFYKWTGTPNASTSEEYAIIQSAGYDPSKALSDAKYSTIETVLGPNPVMTRNGTFNDVKYAGLGKVLTDNGLI